MHVFNVSVRMGLLCITYGAFWYYGGDLSIQNVYKIWGIFDRINGTVNHASNMINWASRILVSARRLNNYICSEEIDLSLINWNKEEFVIDESENAIEIENGNFYWANPEQEAYVEKKKKEEKEKEEREKIWFYQCRRKNAKAKVEEKKDEEFTMTNIVSTEDLPILKEKET